MEIKEAIEKAERLESNLPESVISDLKGMSSPCIWHLLNNLIQGPYLEIGVWKGSTLIAALYDKKIKATAIDDFSQFGGPRTEFSQVTQLYSISPFRFIDGDCFDPAVIFDVDKCVKYYFYDGGHTEQDQYNALVKYLDKMADEFVYIVDDWNMLPVQEGTTQAIHDLNLEVIERHERFTPKNGHKETWWNGIAIFRLKKPVG